MPGIRSTVLASLLGELPDLVTLRRRVASLTGLAPDTRKRIPTHLSERRKAREALYIATLYASRRIPALTAIRVRVCAMGKSTKTILFAVARHLLIILNALVRKRQPIALA